jgi:hypothetical protein
MRFHPSNSTIQKGRPLNIHVMAGMDLPKLYATCTPEKHWQSVLVNAESVSHPVMLSILGAHDSAALTSLLAKFYQLLLVTQGEQSGLRL